MKPAEVQDTNLLRNLITAFEILEDSGDGEERVSVVTSGNVGEITGVARKLENTKKPFVIYGGEAKQKFTPNDGP